MSDSVIIKRIAIYGAGGFGKEVRGMIEMQPGQHRFAGFIDDYIQVADSVVKEEYDDVLVAVADPVIRKRIVESWALKEVDFRKWVNADIQMHPSVKIGKGSILCPGVKMTVEITVGNFVIINLNSTIGHDVAMGDFCSIMPSVNISGNVKMGECVYIGVGATILQNLTIGNGAVIGAGAVVTHSVGENQKVMGVPARI